MHGYINHNRQGKKMKRQPVAMVKRVQQINDHTIECYQIVWNTTDNDTPTTRVYKRLSNPGLGVVCYCAATRYKKTCYHIKLARTFVQDALSHTPTDTPDKRTDTP